MTASSVLPSFPTFNDVDGNPLESGFIYIGLPNLNPEVAPKQAFFDKEMTIPAPQPIRTIGGYPSRNGTPTQLYVDGDFSLTVRDKNGALIYNAATESLRFSPFASGIYDFDDVATLLADTSSGFGAGSIWRTRSEGFSYEEAPTSATDQHVTTAGGVKLYVLAGDFGLNVKAFGAVGDGVTDDTAAIQAAIDAVRAANGGSVLLPAGSYVCSSTITLKQGVNLVGEGRAHHPIYAGGDKRGSVLLITVGAGQDAFVFESAVKGHFGVYNLSIFEAGSAAFQSIVNITGVLHPVMEDVEVACLNTRRGLGVLIQDDGAGALTLYGSFRNFTAHNVIDGIKILNDCNANSFIGGSINCSRSALIMDGTTSFPVATSFTGMSFEGMYVAADADVDFFTSPLGIQGWDITQTNGYRFNFLNIIKAQTTIFSGCYFELGGYPDPYDDGVNGSHPAIATVAIEPATSSDARSTGFYNCRFSGAYIYDSGENTRANNIAGPTNYSSEKPSFLSLRRATSQTITAFAWTTIAYTSSPTGDQSVKHDGTTTVTFTQSGTYMVTANIGFAATTATSDYVQARIVCAGTNYVGPNFPKTSASNLETGATVSALVNVAVGDTLTVQTFNASSSGSMDTEASGANDLYIVKIA